LLRRAVSAKVGLEALPGAAGAWSQRGIGMSILTFFHPVLDALSDGRVIRKAVVWALRILAVLALLGGLYAFINILKYSFQSPTAEYTIGGVLLALIFIAAVGCAAQILFYRAAKIDGLTDSTFTVIPIVSILFRAAGEVYATLGAAVGVGGCFFIWLTKSSPQALLFGFGSLLPSAPAGETFVGGLVFMAYLCVYSFLTLVLFYFLAEGTLLLVDIAHNVGLLRGHFLPTPQPAAAPPAPAPAYQPPAAPAYQPPAAPAFQPPPPPAPSLRCPACGTGLEPGSVFCGNCGNRIR
jgi:hypothetical protein